MPYDLDGHLWKVISPGSSFTDMEYFAPLTIFRNAGAIVTVASTNLQQAERHTGKRIDVDQKIEGIKLKQC
jgi:putative intracellular protease/amidase